MGSKYPICINVSPIYKSTHANTRWCPEATFKLPRTISCLACGQSHTLSEDKRFATRAREQAQELALQTAAQDHEFPGFLTGPTVSIKVHASGKIYTLHKDRLLAKSDWFKKNFDGKLGGSEAVTGTVTLQDEVDTEDAVEAFCSWVYLDRYSVKPDSSLEARCLLHARVYVLAERFMLDSLKSLAHINLSKELELFGLIDTTALADVIDLVYTYLPRRSSASALSTDSSPPTGEDKTKPTEDIQPDPMQRSIAQYAAKNIKQLRTDSCFTRCLQEYGEFMVDMLRHIDLGDGN